MRLHTICIAFAIALLGCGGEERPPANANISSTEIAAPRQAVGWPDLGRGTARFIRIDLGPDSFAECQKLSPKFPFDSATTYAQDREQLVALASCLSAPNMRDRTVILVGRADPRGTDGYNQGLGLRRANAIKQLLIENGIAADRILVSSEGATDAVGDKPEYSYGYDRRVDVIVRGGTHAP